MSRSVILKEIEERLMREPITVERTFSQQEIGSAEWEEWKSKARPGLEIGEGYVVVSASVEGRELYPHLTISITAQRI